MIFEQLRAGNPDSAPERSAGVICQITSPLASDLNGVKLSGAG